MDTILFVSHEASRTGAPASLLAIVRELAQSGMSCEVLVLRNGPLVAEFASICPVTVVWKAPPPVVTTERFLLRLILKIVREVSAIPGRIIGRIRLARFMKRIQSKKIRAVYLNSAVSSSVIHQMRRLDCPIISHIHELSWGLLHSGHPDNLATMLSSSAAIVVPAQCVADHLSSVYGVPSDRLHVIPEAVADPHVIDQKSNIPSDAFVIAMAGTVDWRKGIDLFVALGRALRDSLPQAHLLWIGGGREFPLFQRTWRSLYQIDDALAARFHFVGEQPSVASLLNRADIFALTSREDPLPLVHIEAAMLHKPIVCFSASGGAPEWIGEAGIVVPYQDVQAMTNAIIQLANEPERRKKMGEIGRAMVIEKCVPEVVAGEVRTVIEQVL